VHYWSVWEAKQLLLESSNLGVTLSSENTVCSGGDISFSSWHWAGPVELLAFQLGSWRIQSLATRWRPHVDKAKCWGGNWPQSPSQEHSPRPAKWKKRLLKASLENPLMKKIQHRGVLPNRMPLWGAVAQHRDSPPTEPYFPNPLLDSWISVLLDVQSILMKGNFGKSAPPAPPNPKAPVTTVVPLKKQKNKSCPKHMQCDQCLLLLHMFYNHWKEMCEKCLS
jgi:hypothetical protein